MLKTVEMKLYLKPAQEETFSFWMRTCCWLYNKALEQRIKAYRRRGESISLFKQYTWLTLLRSRVPTLASMPVQFERDALRRVDRGFQDFFRRLKAGEKPGFPRFRPSARYNSLECLLVYSYIRPGNLLSIPKLGRVRFRAGNQMIPGKQKLLRITRRASGWYAQVVVDDGQDAPPKALIRESVGIDLGLESFATLSNGEKVRNPRFFRASERKLKRAQQRLSRAKKCSRNQKKAVRRVARIYERIKAQRKDFTHQESRKLINRFDLIGFEKLNIRGLASSKLAKSVCDAAWGMFLFFLTYKAEYAGKLAVSVDARRTSQECPQCGAVKAKDLSERTHRCPCGCILDRDTASAQVILARALGVAGATACGGIDLCNGSASVVSRPCEAGSPNDASHR